MSKLEIEYREGRWRGSLKYKPRWICISESSGEEMMTQARNCFSL